MENYFNLEAKYYEKKAAKGTANKLGLGIIIFIVFQNIISLVLSVLVVFIPNFNGLLKDSVFNYLYSSFLTVTGFIFCGLISIRMQKRKVSEIIEFNKPKKHFIPLIFIGMGVCMLANIITSVIGSLLPFTPVMPDIGTPTNLSGIIIYFITTAFLPALVEEFFFRGVIYGSLKKFGKVVAIVVSSVLFSLIHGNLVQIPFAFMVGLILGYITAEADSIWPAVIVHFLNNFMSCVLTYIGVFFNESIQNFAFVIYMLIFIAIGLVSIVIYLTKQKNKAFIYEKTPHLTTSVGFIKHILLSPLMVVFYVYTVINVVLLQLVG